MLEEKEKIRKIMREKRKKLSNADRDLLSHRACHWLISSPLWRGASIIGLFVSLPEEISSNELLEQAWHEGKQVFLPKINPREKGLMDFHQCTSMSDLKKGKFGLLEPSDTSMVLSQADLMIVPGLAFDMSGNRLGYGGGYYDRYLASRPHKQKPCVGLAYGFQIQDRLCNNEYDFKMSFLCTEEGVIWSNA